MRRIRPLARIAWRDIVRNRARSLLVLALIALPVAACVGGLVIFQTTDPTAEDRATDLLGEADLLVRGLGSAAALDNVADLLPAGSDVAPLVRRGVPVRLPGGQVDALLLGVDPDGPARGMVEVQSGRVPRTDREATVSTALAEVLRIGPGDDVTVAGEDLHVVGTHRRPEDLSGRSVLTLPEAAVAGDATAWLAVVPEPSLVHEAAASLHGATDSDGQSLYDVTTRATAEQRGPSQTLTLTVLGSLALVEAALIAAAAFAVSTRRRQRELGLVAATGGSDRDLRRVVLFSGLGLGVVGSTIGVAFGIGVVAVMTPWLQGWADRVVAGVRLPGPAIAAIGVGGVAAATLAAWAPARSASRVPILLALSGRRPPPGSAGRGLTAGVALVAVGVGAVLIALPVGVAGATALVPVLIVAGSVLTVLGFGMTSPWLLERAGRFAPLLPVGPRLALRDTARFRTRNGPVVTAVLAGLAMSVALASGLQTMDADEAADYQPRLRADQLEVSGAQAGDVAREVARRLDAVAVAEATYHAVDSDAPRSMVGGMPGSRQEALRAPPPLFEIPPGAFGPLGIGGSDLVRALGGDDAAVAALQKGHVVVYGPVYRGVERLDLVDGGSVPVHVVDQPVTTAGLPNRVVSPETATRLDPEILVRGLGTWVVRLPAPVTAAQHGEAREVAVGATDTIVLRETGFQSSNVGLYRVVLVLAILTGLVVVAIALALSAAETRADQRTLLAVGADPRMRRSLAAGRAVVLAGLGGMLAIPAGLLPTWGVVRLAGDVPFVVPWWTIAIVAVGLPLTAVIGAWVLTPPSARWTAYRPVPR